MKQKIMELINENYPISIRSIEPVTDEMFRCYSDKEKYFARITNYRSYEMQLEEVNWTNALYDQGIGVSPTISSLNENLLYLPLPNDLLYSMLPKYLYIWL